MTTTATLLKITGVDFDESAVRGITETITLIAESKQLARTSNGGMIDVSEIGFKKFALSYSCDDINMPDFHGLFPGSEHTIDCITEWQFRTVGGTQTRPAVAGSSRVEGEFTYYRPVLVCVFVDRGFNRNEYDAAVGWSMAFEEV
jgi:hypothetical protein